jgi:hypothetical protein
MDNAALAAAVGAFLGARGIALLDAIFKPIAGAIGEDLLARYRSWASKNVGDVVESAAEMLESAGKKPVPVPGRILFPILAQAALEDDDDLKKRWAALLAHAADPDGNVEVRRAFATILVDLSRDDVRVLDWLFKRGKPQKNHLSVGDDDPQTYIYASGMTQVISELQISRNIVLVTIANLFRLGLCEPPGNAGRGYTMTDGTQVLGRIYSEFIMTPLGVAFMRACTFE